MAIQLFSPSVSTATAGISGSGTGSAPDIERPQRQLKNLQKPMQNFPAQNLPLDQTREQAQLLSRRIQVAQVQITRLQAQNDLEQAETRLENRYNASKSALGTSATDATVQMYMTTKVTGSSALNDVQLQARYATQAQAAQAARPASAGAITPAEPLPVFVKA